MSFFIEIVEKEEWSSGHLAHSSKLKQNQLYSKLYLKSDFLASFFNYVMVEILQLP